MINPAETDLPMRTLLAGEQLIDQATGSFSPCPILSAFFAEGVGDREGSC